MERVSADLGEILKEQSFESIKDANRFLESLLTKTGGCLPRRKPTTALERAQDLCWDAYDEPNPARAMAKAKRALELSPDCADAYNILAAYEARTTQEALTLYEEGVKAGERALGSEFFEENEGHFWALLETRPYMRARAGLAEALWALGRLEEAATHYEAMLALNPNDNQGNRYHLLALYLGQGRLEDSAKLLDRYREDAGAEFAWTRVLVAFLRGEQRRAKRLLREARKSNPHVPPLLLGRRRLPQRSPDYVELGGRDEAGAYVGLFGGLWRKHPEALAWLEAALPQRTQR